MRAEISKAFAGQGKQGYRLGPLPSQTCCVKQSSARLLVAEGLLIRTGIQMARRKGFSGSDCDSAFAGDGAPFALGTSSTYRAAQDSTAPLAQGSGLVPPRCCWGRDTAAHVPARPPAASHLQKAAQGQA